MDVGAINGIRAAVPTGAAHEGDLERRPILAARAGPAPISVFVSPPLAEEMLRAALHSRAALLDLDPVLAKPAAEEPGQSGAPAVLQAAILREPEENRARREASGQGQPGDAAGEGANPIAQFHARGRFSQTHAVDADSAGDLVARFSDAAHDRTRER
jgi:hypothetical protein